MIAFHNPYLIALLMRALLAGALASPFAAPAHAQDSEQQPPRNGWLRYEVEKVGEGGSPCCYEGNRRGCSLERRSEGLTIQGNISGESIDGASDSDRLLIYLRYQDAQVDDVRVFGSNCPVDHDVPVQDAGQWPAARSLALLDGIVQQSGKADDEAVVAIALHADAAATGTLQRYTASGQPQSRREAAVFWLGQTRGRAGAEHVETLLRSPEESMQLRKHTVFALSQSEAIDAYSRLASLARDPDQAKLQGTLAFWMAQTQDPRARADLLAMLSQPESGSRDPDEIVFAISQLEDGGDEALADIVRGDYPRSVKKKALFWLGQSGSDAALQLLDEVVAAGSGG